MADGVPITAGAGTTILTDDTGVGGHAQVVKLAISTDGSGTLIPATGTTGLKVDLGDDNDVTVTGTVTANLAAGTNNIGDVDVLTLPALPAGTNNIGDVDVLTVPADPFGANADAASASGSISAKLRFIASTGIPVTGTVSVQSNSANLATESTVNSVKTAVELIDDAVKADDAAFTVATDKVVMAGRQAVAHGANPDAADAGDAVVALTNRHRVQFMIGGHPNVKAATYITTGSQTDDNVLAAISTGTKYVVTRITITLDEATTVGVAVRLGFGATTIPALGASGADAVDGIIVYHPGLVPGAGIQLGDGTGILAVGGDGEELRITCEAPTSGTLVVSVSYYTIES